jgi:hypothetical protein
MNFVSNYNFGYPEKCNKCILTPECQKERLSLNVKPTYKDTESSKRLMLIVQDPTIRNKKRVVDMVLMLNKIGSLYKWLKELLGDKFENIDIYATNVVKCTFINGLPTEREGLTALKFLLPFFNNCKEHLFNEIYNY